MTALETLRALKCATAADVAAASGIAIEYVYLDLVAAESAGLAAVRLHSSRAAGRTLRWWVAL